MPVALSSSRVSKKIGLAGLGIHHTTPHLHYVALDMVLLVLVGRYQKWLG